MLLALKAKKLQALTIRQQSKVNVSIVYELEQVRVLANCYSDVGQRDPWVARPCDTQGSVVMTVPLPFP